MRFGERIDEEIFSGARPSRWYGLPFVSLRSRVLIGFCVLRVTTPDEPGSWLNSHPARRQQPQYCSMQRLRAGS